MEKKIKNCLCLQITQIVSVENTKLSTKKGGTNKPVIASMQDTKLIYKRQSSSSVPAIKDWNFKLKTIPLALLQNESEILRYKSNKIYMKKTKNSDERNKKELNK